MIDNISHRFQDIIDMADYWTKCRCRQGVRLLKALSFGVNSELRNYIVVLW